MKVTYETKACGRCGGSGKYSYCQRYGTKCFGCHGSGRVYTANGKRARQWFIDQTTTTWAEIAVGDHVVDRGLVLVVSSIDPSGIYTLDTKAGERICTYHTSPSSTVQRRLYGEQWQAVAVACARKFSGATIVEEGATA